MVVVTERWWRRGSGEKGGQQQRAHSSEHGERGEQQQRAQEQLGRRTRASARGQRRLRVEWPFRSSVLLKRLSLARWAMEKKEAFHAAVRRELLRAPIQENIRVWADAVFV